VIKAHFSQSRPCEILWVTGLEESMRDATPDLTEARVMISALRASLEVTRPTRVVGLSTIGKALHAAPYFRKSPHRKT
jgi:hypothetical protein